MATAKQKTHEEKFQLQKIKQEKLTAFFYDLAKLSFGGLVISVLQTLFTKGTLDINSLPVVFAGLIATFAFALIGYLTIQE